MRYSNTQFWVDEITYFHLKNDKLILTTACCLAPAIQADVKK